MKTFPILALILLLAVGNLKGQDLTDQFEEKIMMMDTAGQRQLLQKWEQQTPTNAELLLCYATFYSRMGFAKQNDETKKLPEGQSAVFDRYYLSKSLAYINKGIKQYPYRLDMRLTKMLVLAQAEEDSLLTAEAIKTVTFSATHHDAWTWRGNSPKPNAATFMLRSIQDYVVILTKTGASRAPHIRSISRAIIKWYPQHIESYSNVAATYLMTKDYKNALQPLLQAEKKWPANSSVLINLAYVYSQINSKEKAQQYYRKVVQYGNAQERAYAEEALKSM